MYGLLAGCNEDPQFMLRHDRRGARENECESTELSVCSRGEAAVSLYQQNGKLCTPAGAIANVRCSWVWMCVAADGIRKDVSRGPSSLLCCKQGLSLNLLK